MRFWPAVTALDRRNTDRQAALEITLFSQHLVRTGKLEPARAKELKRLQGYREAADYDRHFRFDRVGAEV